MEYGRGLASGHATATPAARKVASKSGAQSPTQARRLAPVSPEPCRKTTRSGSVASDGEVEDDAGGDDVDIGPKRRRFWKKGEESYCTVVLALAA